MTKLDKEEVFDGAKRLVEAFRPANLSSVLNTVVALFTSPNVVLREKTSQITVVRDFLIDYLVILSTDTYLLFFAILSTLSAPTPSLSIFTWAMQGVMSGVYDIGLSLSVCWLGGMLIQRLGNWGGIEVVLNRAVLLVGYAITPALISRIVLPIPLLHYAVYLSLLYVGYLILSGVSLITIRDTTQNGFKLAFLGSLSSLGVIAMLLIVHKITAGMRILN